MLPILGFVAAMGAIYALIAVAIAKINMLHSDLNSRLTELLQITAKASHALGVKEESDRNRATRQM